MYSNLIFLALVLNMLGGTQAMTKVIDKLIILLHKVLSNQLRLFRGSMIFMNRKINTSRVMKKTKTHQLPLSSAGK